jgi:hypothetical protein
MKYVVAASAFGLGLWAHTCAFAAIVTVERGQVLINAGQGYHLIEGSTNANPGDTVVVNPGGLARIIYPDGCATDVRPPAVVPVGAQSPCQQQAKSAPSPEAPQPWISNTTVLIGGGAILATGGALALILAKQKDKSASP